MQTHEVRRIFAQAPRQLAELAGRSAAFTQETLELRQAFARERAHVLPVLGNELVELRARIREVVRNYAHPLHGRDQLRPGLADDVEMIAD